MIQANYQYKNYERALKQQKARYQKRVSDMMRADILRCYTLTFTFSDKTLAKTTKTTRLRYIKTFLNQQATDYILNCDYGKLNEREHYHAVILSRYKIIIFDAYKNGFIKARKLHDTIENQYNERTQPTAERLTNHAFKETTRNSKIIYSRASNKINPRFKRLAYKKLKEYNESEIGKAKKQLFYAQMLGNRQQAIQNKRDLEKWEKEHEELERELHIFDA